MYVPCMISFKSESVCMRAPTCTTCTHFLDTNIKPAIHRIFKFSFPCSFQFSALFPNKSMHMHTNKKKHIFEECLMFHAEPPVRPTSVHLLSPIQAPAVHAVETQSRGISAMSMRADHTHMLSAPAPLPRIPGFTPAQTPDSIASARTPL